jgi:hypothetical protein
VEALDLYTFSSGRVRRRTRAGRGWARQEAAHLEAPGTCAGAKSATPVLSSIGQRPTARRKHGRSASPTACLRLTTSSDEE